MDLDWIDGILYDGEAENDIERQGMPAPAVVDRKVEKRNMIRLAKMQKAEEAISEGLPKTGESFHIVSGGVYDFWNLFPVSIKMLGGVDYFYGSTWTMNRDNVNELLTMIDNCEIKQAAMITGLYFKRRESAVYAMLLNGMLSRGHRFTSFRNHAKVVLLEKGDDYIVFEGSANFTSNPRMENFIISNDKPLYEFHKSWMEEMLLADG